MSEVAFGGQAYAAPSRSRVRRPQSDRPIASSSHASRSRLKLTRRGRGVLLTIVAAPLVAVALFAGINAGGATATDSSTPLKSITMPAGESLWQVATQIAPNADPRDFIDDVVSVNRLSSTDVQPGQRLKIPAKYEQ